MKKRIDESEPEIVMLSAPSIVVKEILLFSRGIYMFRCEN
jgi:hypothetical protein